MKKILVSMLLLGGFGTYLLYSNSTQAQGASQPTLGLALGDSSNEDESPAASPQEDAAEAPRAVATKPVATPAKTTTTPAPVVKKTTGKYVDGTYVGSPADAYYGTVQVKATVSGGKLANVTFLQSPGDRSTSIMINRQAMPMLAQEAVSAQSANVSGVSGASDTSQAFIESLSSALAKAKA